MLPTAVDGKPVSPSARCSSGSVKYYRSGSAPSDSLNARCTLVGRASVKDLGLPNWRTGMKQRWPESEVVVITGPRPSRPRRKRCGWAPTTCPAGLSRRQHKPRLAQKAVLKRACARSAKQSGASSERSSGRQSPCARGLLGLRLVGFSVGIERRRARRMTLAAGLARLLCNRWIRRSVPG